MSTTYPTSKQTFTDPSGTSQLTSPDHAGLHTDHNDTVEAIEDKVGIGSGTPTTGAIFYSPGNGTSQWLGVGSANTYLTSNGTTPSWGTISQGVATWTPVPGNPTRTADATITLTDTGGTNNYQYILGRGRILKWSSGGTFQTAFIGSASYDGTSVVTLSIVGNAYGTAGSALYYGPIINKPEQFIIPGNLGTGTDQAKTYHLPQTSYILGFDFYVKTAGSGTAANSFTPYVGTTAVCASAYNIGTNTSLVNQVADMPATEWAAGSAVTFNVTSVSATAPIELYAYMYSYPRSYRYQS